MSLPRWKLTDLAWNELKRLAADGVALTPQDALDIQALSIDALDADCDDSALSSGTPVKVGGRWLWPLTVAGSVFVSDVAPLAGNHRAETHVFAYAMAYGRDEARMAERGRDALRSVKAFARTLTCTPARLLEAVMTPYADMPPHVEDPDADDEERESVAKLARAAFCAIGGDLRAYEYQMSIQTVVDLLRQHARQSLAAGDDPANHPRVDALRRLGLKVEEIRARAKADAGTETGAANG
ncbi:MAG: hypothetical protein ILM98_13955 [Kiritimatiellae bacterium]|nr:hypothetical protein [Kiritimatiellia bacterium]